MSFTSMINATNNYSYLDTQESQVIGNLFRELLTFERRPYTQKTVDQINQVIDMATNNAKPSAAMVFY